MGDENGGWCFIYIVWICEQMNKKFIFFIIITSPKRFLWPHEHGKGRRQWKGDMEMGLKNEESISQQNKTHGA